MLLEKEASKRSIATIVAVSPTLLRHFIRPGKLDPKASKDRTGGHDDILDTSILKISA